MALRVDDDAIMADASSSRGIPMQVLGCFERVRADALEGRTTQQVALASCSGSQSWKHAVVRSTVLHLPVTMFVLRIQRVSNVGAKKRQNRRLSRGESGAQVRSVVEGEWWKGG